MALLCGEYVDIINFEIQDEVGECHSPLILSEDEAVFPDLMINNNNKHSTDETQILKKHTREEKTEEKVEYFSDNVQLPSVFINNNNDDGVTITQQESHESLLLSHIHYLGSQRKFTKQVDSRCCEMIKLMTISSLRSSNIPKIDSLKCGVVADIFQIKEYYPTKRHPSSNVIPGSSSLIVTYPDKHVKSKTFNPDRPGLRFGGKSHTMNGVKVTVGEDVVKGIKAKKFEMLIDPTSSYCAYMVACPPMVIPTSNEVLQASHQQFTTKKRKIHEVLSSVNDISRQQEIIRALIIDETPQLDPQAKKKVEPPSLQVVTIDGLLPTGSNSELLSRK
jgi:hypothetical protein